MFAGHVTVGACVSWIVTVKVHVVSGLFADASLAVHDTVVTPTGNVEPDAGEHETVAPGQLSVAVGVVYVTEAEHSPAPTGVVMLAGHVIEGASLSRIVTVNVHVPSGLSGDASLAVHVTVVVPTGNVDPDAGAQLTVAPGQLSVAVGVV